MIIKCAVLCPGTLAFAVYLPIIFSMNSVHRLYFVNGTAEEGVGAPELVSRTEIVPIKLGGGSAVFTVLCGSVSVELTAK